MLYEQNSKLGHDLKDVIVISDNKISPYASTFHTSIWTHIDIEFFILIINYPLSSNCFATIIKLKSDSVRSS